MKKLYPTEDHIVIKVDPKQTESRGIAIPEEYQREPNTGIVIEVGPGRQCESTGLAQQGQRSEMSVAKGDEVVFRYSGQSVELEEATYNIIDEQDVLAVIRNN